MNITIYTNPIPGGWSPTSPYLKGSEDCVKSLSEVLSNFYMQNVTVYTDLEESLSESHFLNYNGVIYKPREELNLGINDPDVLIIWKDRDIDLSKISDKTNVIKWSSDIEDKYDISRIDYWVNLTKYHSDSNAWVPTEIESIIPHGVDYNFLSDHNKDRTTNTILYCSSPDRGLFNLLNDWKKIKEAFPDLKLRVTYGTQEILNFGGPEVHHRFNQQLTALTEQKDIEYLGAVSKERMAELYWESEYWVLPLQKPKSELFCLNLFKAKWCGCKSIINPIGALRENAGEYIDYQDFLKGDISVQGDEMRKSMPYADWREIVKYYWSSILGLK